MSFDDLPPGSKPPRNDEGEASGAAQAPSGQDAPPSAKSRRRRSKPAGTAAASSPEISENLADKPAPKASKRQKRDLTAVSAAAEVSLNKSPILPDNSGTPSVEPPIEAPLSAPPEKRPPRGGSRGRKTPEVVQMDDPPEPGGAIAGPAPETLLPVDETARTSGRRRRGPARQVVAIELAPPPEPAEPPIVSATPPPQRGRARRSRLPAAAAVPITEASSLAEVPSTVEPLPDSPPPGRRRTRTRGGRPVVMTEPTSPSIEAGEELPSDSTTLDADQDQSLPGRTRRRRSRRSPTRSETDAPAPALLDEGEQVEDVYTVPDIDRTVGAHLISRNGMPEIHIDGIVYPPVLFFGNIEEDESRDRVASEVKRAAEAGVHIHSTIIELPCPVSEISPAFGKAAERLQFLIESDPDGYVIPRVVFVPARGWKRENPSEVAAYSDGTLGDPSVASDKYWREAEHSIELLITHLSRQEWGARVAGYHLERGEWFQPLSQGYDRCPANRESFREWLKHKYNNNVILLRAAWYNAEVQFGSAEIPELVAKPNPQRAFYEPRRERATIDFHEYTSAITVKRLIALATAAKRAAEHRALISVCYGYTFEFGHTFNGHFALGTLEDSRAIDLICGPPSYRDRNQGGAASFPAPIDSPPLHGKLWLTEDDTKTFLAPQQQDPEDFNIRLDTRVETEHSQQRAFGRIVAHTTGIGFMDLWGEGWLDDEALWKKAAVFVSRYSEQLRHKQHPRVPEVVAIVDEKSLLHVQRGEQFLRRITAGSRDSLQRAGVSFGVYLQSDLLCDALPLDAKLYLFLTPYRLTAEQRVAVKERLQTGGKTLAWLYAPGSCEERPSVGGALEETATGAIGIAIRQQEWNSEVGSRVVDSHHAVTDRLQSRDIGARERLNPSFYVDDPDATILAEYHGSGVPSLAVKNCGTWNSIFVGDPVLPLDLLRGICRFAGVHVWTPQGDDVIDIGNGHVTIHSAKEGQRIIRLPDATGLYDVTESRHVADEIREHRFYMRVGETRCFYVGSAERFIEIGLPNVAPPGPGRPREIVNGTPSHAFEREAQTDPEPVQQRPRNSDIETLEAVLSMDISDLNGADLEALNGDPIEFIFAEGSEIVRSATSPLVPDATTGEVIAGGRRRRRRGGRGRGRRRLGDGSDEAAVATGSETGPVSEIANTAGYVDDRNLTTEKSVWASEYDENKEMPHADSGPTAHSEGDTSL